MVLKQIERSIGQGFWYDGQRTEDFSIKVLEKRRPLTAPLIPKTIQAEGHIGEFYNRTDYAPTKFDITITYKAETYSGVRELTRRISEWLSPELGPRPLIFDDEPEVTYYAVLEATEFLEQTDKRVKTKIKMSCPHPFGVGPEERFIIRAADATLQRNTAASTPDDGDFVGQNEVRGTWILALEEFYATTVPPKYDPEYLSVLLDEKVFVENGTINLVKDPAFCSITAINAAASPWKWIAAPSAAKNESSWKTSNDIMTNFSGWHTFACVCNGTENIGIRQQIAGVAVGDIISLSGRLACKNYKSGILHFDITAENSGGTVIWRSPGKTIAKECFEFISVDYEYLIEEGLTVPANTSKLFVNIYGTNNPVFIMLANQIQIEKKPYCTSFICDPTKDVLPGTQGPPTDDVTQYERLPDVIKWPGPQVVNPQEGLISIWFYPIQDIWDGVNIFSAGDAVTAGGSPYGAVGMYCNGGNIMAIVGSGSGYYIASFPKTKILKRQWNYLVMNWRQFDTLDFYVNGEKASVTTAGINITQVSGQNGYIVSDQANGGQMPCLWDNFYVRGKKVDTDDLEGLLADLEAGNTAYAGIGIDTFTNYNLNAQEVFYSSWNNPIKTLSSSMNSIISRVGTAPTFPIIECTFFKSATTIIIKQSETGRKIQVDYDFKSGDTLIIDCARQLIKINSMDTMSGLTLDSDFFELHAGINNIYVDGVSPATVVMTYKPNYI